MSMQKSPFSDFYSKTYYQALPYFKQERTQRFTLLILTLIALSVFIVFAITPTIGTIINLQKQLEDEKVVDAKLTEKLRNLSILQQKFVDLQPDMPTILEAIPENPQAPLFVAQVNALAQKNGVTLTRLQVFQVALVKTNEGIQRYSSYEFALEAEGTYDTISSFSSSLMQFQRIITTNTISLSSVPSSPGTVRLVIRGQAYFKL